MTQEPGGHALFDTPLGKVGLAWSGDRLTRITLPGQTPAEALQRLREAGGPEAPPPSWVRQVGARLGRHLGGRADDLRDVPLDLSWATDFSGRVYRALREVGSGELVSYGELAAMAGSPGAARAVGGAMARNRFPLVVPCHRVVGSDGPGGFSSPGELDDKALLLAAEGVALERPSRERPLFPEATPEALRHLRQACPKLGAVIERVGPPSAPIARRQAPFRALCRSITYQQLSGKAAGTIFGRFRQLFPGRAFPRPELVLDTPDEVLRGAGLSRAKVAAIKDLAARVLDGTLPSLRRLQGLDDEEVVRRLVVVRGVGRWTAEMFMMFSLGRTDLLPVDDLGIRKGFQVVYRTRSLPEKKRMERLAAPWRPYRSLGAWYLWRAADGL